MTDAVCRDWYFYRDGAEPQRVDLPHDAMLTQPRDAACRNAEKTGYFPGGTYRYEKTFSIGEADAERSVVLLFEGVYRHASVLLNSREVARHAYGYTEFTADLTGLVRPGENTVRVIVDNRLEPNSRWYSGSGIYRPVRLMIREKEHIEDLVIRTVSHSPAVIEVSAKADGASVRIYDGEILVAAGELGRFELPNAKLWSAEEPHLYTCVVSSARDEVRETFGIRTIEWSAKTGLLINGGEVLLRGGCIHHDNGILGACAFADAEERRVRILKAAGYNAIRSAHNPCSRALLDACDRLGMYVMDEAFDGWYTPKTYHDYARDFEACHEADIAAMVAKDINHPSVILYSLGNEVTETAQERGIRLAGRMARQVHTLDATRPVTCGVNAMLNALSARGIAIYKDSGAYRPEPLPPIEGTAKERKSGSAFFNFVMQNANWITDMISGSRAGGAAIREVAAKLDVLGLNYGSRRYDKDAAAFLERIMVGSETMIHDLPYNWARVKKHKAIIGDFAWTAMDYLGEAGVGDWTYFAAQSGLMLTAGCGAIDLIGTPGAESFFQQVVWGLRVEPYLCVRPVKYARETPHKSRWRFTDAIDSWSWQGCEGERAVVEVFSGAHSAVLYRNGRRIGKKRIRQFRAVFQTRYAPGILEAAALDRDGRELSRTQLRTAGDETVLSVSADKTRLRANGQDLCFLSIALTDREGICKPAADVCIRVAVRGPGRLQGLGSARCKTDEVFDQDTHETYLGRALAVIRAGYRPGEICVTLSADGMAERTIAIAVVEEDN